MGGMGGKKEAKVVVRGKTGSPGRKREPYFHTPLRMVPSLAWSGKVSQQPQMPSARNAKTDDPATAAAATQGQVPAPSAYKYKPGGGGARALSLLELNCGCLATVSWGG